MRGSAGGLEKLSAGVSGLVKKTLDCTVALGQGPTHPGVKFVSKHKHSVNLVVYCIFTLLNDFVTDFPIQTHRRLNLTLP